MHARNYILYAIQFNLQRDYYYCQLACWRFDESNGKTKTKLKPSFMLFIYVVLVEWAESDLNKFTVIEYICHMSPMRTKVMKEFKLLVRHITKAKNIPHDKRVWNIFFLLRYRCCMQPTAMQIRAYDSQETYKT